ncbi:hypothetical protein BGZ96_001265, partial [Linnemannia gamsii]
MVAVYSFQAYLSNNPSKYPDEPRISSLLWQDYVLIVLSVFFVFVYFYALNGFRFMPKPARAFLLFAPAVLLIYVSIFSMIQATDKDGDGSAFKCGGRGQGGKTLCSLNWANKFIAALLGFLVIYEIVLTLVWGPIEPKRDYLPQHNDGHEQPVVHDGGQTGSTQAMVEQAQPTGLGIGVPTAAVLAGNGATVAPHPGYQASQKPVLLSDNNNNGGGVGDAYKVGDNIQEQDLPPPQVVYQYPAPQQAQFKDQHEQFDVTQPIPTILPIDAQAISQAPLQQQQQPQSQPQSQQHQQQQGAPL